MFFKEEQKIIESKGGKVALLAMVVASLMPYLILSFNFNKTVGKPEVWWIMGGVTLFMVFLMILISKSKLLVRLDKTGLRYSYRPLMREKQILWTDVESYSVVEYNPMKEYGGHGIKKGLKNKTMSFTVAGKSALKLSLKSGKQLLLGTQKAYDLKAALDKLRDFG